MTEMTTIVKVKLHKCLHECWLWLSQREKTDLQGYRRQRSQEERLWLLGGEMDWWGTANLQLLAVMQHMVLPQTTAE